MSAASDAQRHVYLDDHLPYTVKMLHYTYSQMFPTQHRLSWNEHFAAFAVYARSLEKFLTNDDKGNLKARDFMDFEATKGRNIDGPMQLLDRQVFHLAKGRPTEAEDKFSLENAKAVYEWVKENFADFLAKLPPRLREHYNEKNADPANDTQIIAPTPRTASNEPTHVIATIVTPKV
jgi:hypothetical protein